MFFRKGILTMLEKQLDELHTNTIINLQANCRGYLTRRKTKRRNIEELAVSCIQRNVKILSSTKDWSWWRLFVKLRPLLIVNRTEEELKLKMVCKYVNVSLQTV